MIIGIAVGLASGIGALGIGIILSAFFNYTTLVMWAFDMGTPVISDAEDPPDTPEQML